MTFFFPQFFFIICFTVYTHSICLPYMLTVYFQLICSLLLQWLVIESFTPFSLCVLNIVFFSPFSLFHILLKNPCFTFSLCPPILSLPNFAFVYLIYVYWNIFKPFLRKDLFIKKQTQIEIFVIILLIKDKETKLEDPRFKLKIIENLNTWLDSLRINTYTNEKKFLLLFFV